MFRDFEVDRLEAVQEIAFEDKARLQQQLLRASKHLLCTKDALSKAFEDKHQAYADQQSTWQEHHDVHQVNDARIKKLDSKQEKAYLKMRKAYENAEDYYSSRNGESASIYSGKGERHKRKSKAFSAERRQLVDEIIAVNGKFALSKIAFEQSKINFEEVKNEYDTAKSNYDLAKSDFYLAKQELEDATKAYKDRLHSAILRQKLNPEKEYELAKQSGVPTQYLHAMTVRYLISGDIDFFFGGMGDPIGPGHGHYVVSRDGTVKYRRDPLDYHLSRKFIYGDGDYFKSVFY